jgi:hypothetical protein
MNLTNLTEYTKETLHGLEGVVVVIETVKADAAADGLNVVELQTDVELRLAQGGVRVLPTPEWRETPGRPWLYVSVNTIKHLENYFFSVDVQLKQDVSLPRQPSIMTSSATWELGSIGFVNPELMPAKIRESVGAYVDNFISDYSDANSETH